MKIFTMNSLWDFNSAVKLGHPLRSSGGSNRHPILAKYSDRKINFVDHQVRLFLRQRISVKDVHSVAIPSVIDSDNAAVEVSTTDSKAAEAAVTNNQPPLPVVQPELNGTEKALSQVQESVPPKRPLLSAREKLRAARMLSRYNEPKPAKLGMGSKVLEALRESDGGKKRSRLPQAPTNLLDDSKRGMPKQGLTFDLPGGADLFFIVLSVVLISTIMFTTTYIVWKVGAIHFNEY